MSYEREEGVEEHLVERIEQAGGMCIKLFPMALVGLPDRLCLLPCGKIFFVETKAPKGRPPRSWQTRMHKRLEKLGFKTYVPYTKADIERILW